MTADFPISGFRASASSPLFVFKEATPGSGLRRRRRLPRAPLPLPRSTPYSSCLTFCASSWRNPAFSAHSQRGLAPGSPGRGGSLVYTSSRGRFILYTEWNPPWRLRVWALPYPGASILQPPASSPSGSSFCSLERGRPILFTSKLLSRGSCFVPTSTPTSGSPRTAAPLGGPDGRLRQEASSQAPAR